MKKQKYYSPGTAMIDLPRKWSAKALRLMNTFPHGSPSILDFYWRYWLDLGKNKWRGFGFAPDYVGLGTYEEIRQCLIENGFPDLNDDMFKPSGSCQQCCPRSLLEWVLIQWQYSSKERKARLRKEIYDCDCDGH